MSYDVKGFKDFIQHLLWSLRVDHFECTSGPNAYNPELGEQVKRLAIKRGIPRLLSLFSLKKDKPELTEQEMGIAMRQFAEEWAKKREEQLHHLEALEELFKEALAHAEGRVLHFTIPASKVLDGSFFKSRKGE